MNKIPQQKSQYNKIVLIKLITLFICLGALSGCDVLYGLLDKKGAEEKALVGEYIPLEKNPTVEEIQTLLKLYGYDAGKVDGVLGPRTRDTIARFQRENGLEETRFCDAQTWQKLSVFKDNQYIEDGKLNVYKVQSALASIGYDSGKIDGKYGPKTRNAVLAFQKDSDLKVDAKVGYKTLQKLSSQEAQTSQVTAQQ